MTIALAGLCGLRLLPVLSAPVASSHGESGPWLKIGARRVGRCRKGSGCPPPPHACLSWRQHTEPSLAPGLCVVRGCFTRPRGCLGAVGPGTPSS